MMRALTRAAAMAMLTASAAAAQSPTVTGSASALVDIVPKVPAPGRAASGETRAAAELRLRLAGVADGLAADRGGSVRDAKADALEAWVEITGAHADVRAGVGRLTWGRLDEVQPTDVINPIDVAKFLLEGRSEARLAVPFVRARFIGSETIRVEGIVVPVFRAGTFDRLDEESSPFNLLLDLPGPACPPGVPCASRWKFDREPPDGGALQGGARLSATTGRVDWSVSGWNGFVPFGLIAGVSPSDPLALRLVHPRFTMLGADVETVAGQWALRAEAAYFPDRPMQIANQPDVFEGASFEAGAGVDRRAGDFTLSGTVLVRREDTLTQVASDVMLGAVRTNVSVVGGFSRGFNRDRVETRFFSLVNPADRAAFVRGVVTWKPADDIAVETSAGWFAGEGDDVITRFGDRDFAYVRLKYYFGR